jgi:hypothetical protein
MLSMARFWPRLSVTARLCLFVPRLDGDPGSALWVSVSPGFCASLSFRFNSAGFAVLACTAGCGGAAVTGVATLGCAMSFRFVLAVDVAAVWTTGSCWHLLV